MKELYIFLIVYATIILTSCNGISPETAKAFVGEYWMKTTVCTMYERNVTYERGPVWSPVSIYEEDGKLYVRTDNYGAPDTDTSSTAKHEYIIDYPDHPNYVGARYNEEEPESGGIDVVPANNITYVYLVNGFLRTIRNGAYLRSLPIQVKSGSETILNLEAFKPVDVQLTNMDGTKLQTIHVWYEYGPMIKKSDMITWEVELKDDYNNSLYELDHVIHKNTLYKR